MRKATRIHRTLGVWFFCATMAVVHGKPPETKREDLRVITYNIHMWEPGVAELASVIRAAKAGIVGLNEAWNSARNEELAGMLGYNIVYGGMGAEERPGKPHWINGHYMPQVLLTRHRIISTRIFNAMEAGKTPGNPDLDPEVPVYRGGLLAELETAAGNRIVLFVLHLHPWGGADNEKMTTMRLREIEGIVAKLKPHRDMPLLILGDFNTRSHFDGRESGKVAPFLEKQGFADLYRSIHPDPAAMPGFTCGDGRIDYIFHNRHVEAVECRVIGKGVFGSGGYDHSDHLGVFGVVRVGQPDPGSERD